MAGCRKIAHRLSTGWRSGAAALVPLPGRRQAALELPARRPAELLADRRRVQVLAVDLAVRGSLPLHVGLDVPAGDGDQRLHNVDHGDRVAPARVPGPPA